jgi:hypothetical protein
LKNQTVDIKNPATKGQTLKHFGLSETTDESEPFETNWRSDFNLRNIPNFPKPLYITMNSTTISWIDKILIFGNPQLFIRIFVNDRKRVEIEAMRMIF